MSGVALCAFVAVSVTRTGESDAASTDPVWLSFDSVQGSRVLPSNSGTEAGRTIVRTLSTGGGTIESQQSVPGHGRAGRFPAHNPTATGPRAVIAVRNSTGTDVLNPGTRSFTFGVDVRLDSVNESHAAGSLDDGNNLIQRGLYGAAAQYKLEVDNLIPRCRVKGDGGEAIVAGSRISADVAYRIRCSRSATAVTLTVQRFNADGSLGVVSQYVRRASTGNLTFSLATPLSVGGKLRNAMAIEPNGSDQVNGLIDNALLRY